MKIVLVLAFLALCLVGSTPTQGALLETDQRVVTYESDWIPIPPSVEITTYHPFGSLPSIMTMWCMVNLDNGQGIDAVPCQYISPCVIVEHIDKELIHVNNMCQSEVTIRLDVLYFGSFEEYLPICTKEE